MKLSTATAYVDEFIGCKMLSLAKYEHLINDTSLNTWMTKNFKDFFFGMVYRCKKEITNSHSLVQKEEK